MARMFNPPHPGLTLRDDVLPALGLNVTEAAKQLDVSRVALSRLLRSLLVVMAVLLVLPLVGIDLTVLSVFGGALGVGLGFGLQKIASNYVSGFIILLDRSIRIGDVITADQFNGVVKNITSRYVVVKASDGREDERKTVHRSELTDPNNLFYGIGFGGSSTVTDATFPRCHSMSGAIFVQFPRARPAPMRGIWTRTELLRPRM